MKEAVELFGVVNESQRYNLVPSGNHRNQQRVNIQPAPPSRPGQKCPRCKGSLQAWVHTFPTELYAVWKESAKAALLGKYQPGQFDRPVVVYLWLFGGSGFIESRDWDNVQKCVGDAMAEAGVLPVPAKAEPLSDGRERTGGDDVRSIKGWRTHYLDRAEHAQLVGGKAKDLQARLFVQIVDAAAVDPFKV